MYIDIHGISLYPRVDRFVFRRLAERTSGAYMYSQQRSLTSSSPMGATEIRVYINLKPVSIWRGRCAWRMSEDVRRTSRCVPHCVAVARAHQPETSYRTFADNALE